MSPQPFRLKNIAALLESAHKSEEPAQDHRRGSTRTNPSQPPPLGDSRITQWARAAGRCLEAGDFAQTLDGGQVEGELSDIFRETPEFGRSLALRLADFHQGNVGENPTSPQLADWMHQRGWQLFVPPTRHDMLATQTWRRGDVIATDVRPENAILAEADGQIYPFDFILQQTAL